ncbi:MAG: penicillin acylase family protein [Nocardioidaceae bacterium]
MSTRISTRRLATIAGTAVLAAALAAPVAPAAPVSSAVEPAAEPAADQVIPVAGLDQPVTINVDTWGVPHVYAESNEDVFFGQGFNAARDRLFQIDLWRRRGLGRLAQAFGPQYVEQDRAARLFLYRGDMQDEWDAYGEDSEQIATQFTEGVNAYIDWLKKHPAALPPEFRMLDYLPEKWAPEDVVRIRTHALVSGLSAEINRAELACAGRLDLDALRKRLEPDHTTQVPEGLDPCLPENVKDVYDLATQTVRFTGDADRPLAFERPAEEAFEEGSNNWTVSGDRTSTGRPILANDPHRAQQTPSLRYITHLSSPDLDVIGAGEPALPGISIGHNESIAFGLTIFGIDAQDLYVYDLNQDNTRYRYQDGWEPFTNVRERIRVRDGRTEIGQLQYTRHGPVVYVDEVKHQAYAVRSTWSSPGTSAYFASIGYMRAQNWDEFRDTLTRWGAPGENQVYADVEGNIGWKPGGFAPKRIGYDGLLPVPGDGRYEWDRFMTGDELPEVFNPEQGFFATANQFNLPDDHPSDLVTSYEWSAPMRHERIVEALSADDNHSLQDAGRLQNDVSDVRARELLDLLEPLESDDASTREALEFIRPWNGAETLGSPHAQFYLRYWESALNAAVKAELVAPEDRGLFGSVDWLVVMDALRNPGEYFDGGEATRDEVLLTSLRSAYVKAQADLGSDSSQWSYAGNSVRMDHPMGTIDPSLNNGPFAIPGSGNTPIASGRASYRQVIDVGEWDRSLAVNTPGQSGNPDSEHFRDLAPRWAAGEYFPLLYSRSAVEQNTETRIVLVPR